MSDIFHRCRAYLGIRVELSICLHRDGLVYLGCNVCQCQTHQLTSINDLINQDKKRFILQAPKLIHCQLMFHHFKLVCLSLLISYSKGRLISQHSDIKVEWKRLSLTSTLAYYDTAFTCRVKLFPVWGPNYEHFYSRNLPDLTISCFHAELFFTVVTHDRKFLIKLVPGRNDKWGKTLFFLCSKKLKQSVFPRSKALNTFTTVIYTFEDKLLSRTVQLQL